MKGVVFGTSLMVIILGVNVIALAPGWWFLFGDVFLGVGVCLLSAVVKNS
jgi:hypothetical protein